MTENEQIDPAQAGKLAQKIVELLVNEDGETRRRALHAALTLLGDKAAELTPDMADNLSAVGENFFERGDGLRPADYAQLCAAYHYSEYGMSAFSLEEIRQIANDAGLVLPNRIDMTFKSSISGGKKLFQPAGKGLYRPTSAGGLFFKEKWDVKPGKKNKAG